MDSLTFREACRDDVPAVIRLLADDRLGATRESLHGEATASYEHAFEMIDSDPRNALLVAELDGTVVGVLQLTLIPSLQYQGGMRAQIEGVRVAAHLRGRGIGHAMVEEAIARAQTAGCRLVQLATNKQRPRALDFYESLGFHATHEGMKLFLRDTVG